MAFTCLRAAWTDLARLARDPMGLSPLGWDVGPEDEP